MLADISDKEKEWPREVSTRARPDHRGFRVAFVGALTPLCLSVGMSINPPSSWIWGIPLLAYFLVVPGRIVSVLLRFKIEGRLSRVLVSIAWSVVTIMVVGTLLAVTASVGLMPRPFEKGSELLWLNALNIGLWTTCYKRGSATRVIGPMIPMRSDARPIVVGVIPVLWAVASAEMLNALAGEWVGISFFLAIATYVAVLLFVSPGREDILVGLVWGTSLALLLQRSLLSSGLTGFDVNIEFFYASRVDLTGIWNLGGAGNINSVASINVLPVVFADVSGLSIVLLFKTVFPLLFSSVPLLLFQASDASWEPRAPQLRSSCL